MTVELITAENIAKRTVTKPAFQQSYRNNKTIWLMPTRGMIPLRVHVSLRNAAWLPNTPRAHVEIEQMEVAAAYEKGFGMCFLPECADMPFIWTYEEDNVQPRDVFLKLFDAIWTCIDCGEQMPSDNKGNPAEPWVCQNGHKGLDAVAGLYRTKTEPPMYMCFGDPKNSDGGELDYRSLNMDKAVEDGSIVECNGVAMGCTLWRKKIFEGVSKPWFRTLTGAESDLRIGSYTQDLYACRKLKEEKGARFAVHAGVDVAHMDVESGELY